MKKRVSAGKTALLTHIQRIYRFFIKYLNRNDKQTNFNSNKNKRKTAADKPLNLATIPLVAAGDFPPCTI